MLLLICFTSITIAVAVAQEGCMYHHDKTSPFYWKQGEDLCTEAMCLEQGLDCAYPHEAIHDAVLAHRLTTGQDIWYEVDLLEKSFNATFPDEFFGSTNEYKCQGICERPVTTLERIFHDYVDRDIKGNIIHQSRELCFVIGPRVRYSPCSGKPCAIRGIAGSAPYNCVPNVQVSQTVWLYCPNVMTECIKRTIDIPISCSCARFHCPHLAKPKHQGVVPPISGLDSLFSGIIGSPLSGNGISAPVDLGLIGASGVGKPVDVFGGGSPLDVNVDSMFPGAVDIKQDLHRQADIVSDPLAGAWSDGIGKIQQQSQLVNKAAVFDSVNHNSGDPHKIV